MTCPACACPDYFGPASIVVTDDSEPNELLYVTCRRCGENYLVTREAVAL